MKILLINPSIDYETNIDNISRFAYSSTLPNLGILYIAKVLEGEGHKVEVVDFGAENFSEEKIPKIIKSIDAVGLTIIAENLKSSATIISLIRQIDPCLPIMIGGPICSIQPQQTLKHLNANICVKGEGEMIISKIVDALEGKKNFIDIPGVYFNEKGKIKKGPPTELIKELDSIPFPARHLIEKYEYGFVGGISLLKRKSASIMTSRGCPFGCKFCCTGSITKGYRMRSIENIIEELDELNQKYNSVFILDDNFLVNKKRAEKKIDLIIEKQYDLQFWIFGVRTDAANENLFIKMKRAGVMGISMGIESGDQEVLDFYKKGTTLENIEKAVKLSRKAGLYTLGNFIIGSQIETKNHFERTLKMAKKLPLDIAFFHPLIYYKGSELWNDASTEGKVNEDEFWVRASSNRGLSNFSREELETWCINAMDRFFMRPRFFLDQTFQSFVRKDFSFFKKAFHFLKVHEVLMEQGKHVIPAEEEIIFDEDETEEELTELVKINENH